MNIAETKSEGLVREFAITITAADIETETQAKLAEIAKTANMPGFRPGKVPMAVVKTRFGAQVQGDAIKAALDEGARKAVDDNGLNLASQPSVDIKSYEEGKDLEAVFTCEIMPEIKIPDLSKLSIEKPVLPVDEAQIDEALNTIAGENRPSVEVAKPRAAKKGDIVVIDFVGKIDGEAFDGGAAEGHSLELGSNSFIPGFEDGLIGVKPGESRDVKVSFPDDYQAAHLAGKAAIFETKVTAMRELGDAKVDAELATRLGFETLDALKDAVREQLGAQHATALRQAVKKNVLDGLADGEAFDVPPSLFKQEYESVARAMNPAAAEQNQDQEQGQDQEQAPADEGMDDDAKAEAKTVAERRVRLGLLLTEIGRDSKIEVTEADTQRAVIDEARRYPGQEQMVMEYFQKNQQALQQLAGPIFEDKVIDYILELAKVTEVTTDVDTLYKAPEEEAAPKKAAAKKAAKKSTAKKLAEKKAAAKKTTAKKAPAKKAAKKKS